MNTIMGKIQFLQEKLNQMVMNQSNPVDIYAVSTELDVWIVKYYQQQ